MKKILSVALFLASVAAVIPAQAQQVYKCQEDDHITYTNVVKPGSKNCQPVILEPETVFPATPRGGSRSASKNPTPSDFPKVSSTEQTGRDSDRRVVLTQELESEQKALGEARKELDAQRALQQGNAQDPKTLDRLQPYTERVAQHERNIQALNKEISNLK